jgi:predicted HTH transcriptional regulator
MRAFTGGNMDSANLPKIEPKVIQYDDNILFHVPPSDREIEDFIIRYLREKIIASRKELKQYIPISDERLRKLLKSMVSRGILQSIHRGKYYILNRASTNF